MNEETGTGTKNVLMPKTYTFNSGLCFIVFVIFIVLLLVSIMCSVMQSYVEKFTFKIKKIPMKPMVILPDGNCRKAKVAIFMVSTPEIFGYAKYTIQINEMWCKKHNYTFILFDKKHSSAVDLPINFSKIPYALDLLKEYDVVFYIDADAMVVNQNYDIRCLASEFSQDIYFAEDCFDSKNCSKPGSINSGTFLVKNTSAGKKILDEWLTKSLGKCNYMVPEFPNCQNIFMRCVMPIWGRHVKILPFNAINGWDDNCLLIKHAMAMDTPKRTQVLKKEYAKILNPERMHVFE